MSLSFLMISSSSNNFAISCCIATNKMLFLQFVFNTIKLCSIETNHDNGIILLGEVGKLT
ncbi:hypothetical protein ACSBR2_011249 [Camellia fascicularis]